MSDTKELFDAAHGNPAASGATISDSTLASARLALRSQKGRDGKTPLDIGSKFLMEPAALESSAGNPPIAGTSRPPWPLPRNNIPQLQLYFASSLRIDFNSPDRFGVVLGYVSLSSLNVSRTIWETTNRAFSLSSAGTTYQGARAELVALRQAS